MWWTKSKRVTFAKDILWRPKAIEWIKNKLQRTIKNKNKKSKGGGGKGDSMKGSKNCYGSRNWLSVFILELFPLGHFLRLRLPHPGTLHPHPQPQPSVSAWSMCVSLTPDQPFYLPPKNKTKKFASNHSVELICFLCKRRMYNDWGEMGKEELYSGK